MKKWRNQHKNKQRERIHNPIHKNTQIRQKSLIICTQKTLRIDH